jgi:hypothetical protein
MHKPGDFDLGNQSPGVKIAKFPTLTGKFALNIIGRLPIEIQRKSRR